LWKWKLILINYYFLIFMEIIKWKFYIHWLDLTRSSCEKCNYTSSGRNWTCCPAIPVLLSNQLCYGTATVSWWCHQMTLATFFKYQ
jgi:hypothetical protein